MQSDKSFTFEEIDDSQDHANKIPCFVNNQRRISQVDETFITCDDNLDYRLVYFQIPNLETQPYDGNTLQLSLNQQLQIGQISFVNKDQIQDINDHLYAPAPIYMTFQQNIQRNKLLNNEQRFNGLVIKQNGDIKCVDKQILKRFEGVMLDMIKKVASVIMNGRGLVEISMEIRIFEPRSMIERMVDQFSYLPNYLSNLKNNDPVERMKAVVTFVFAGLTMSISQLKPFNPLLGETFQAEFLDGTQIFCEHTKHHPPITNFFIKGKNFTYYGSYELQLFPNFNYNILKVVQKGINVVKFDDGSKITFEMPFVKLSGMVMGERLTSRFGNMIFEDEVNSLKCVIQIGQKSEGFLSYEVLDKCKGKLYYYNSGQAKLDNETLKKMHLNQIIEHDYINNISDIEGTYIKYLKFDDQEVWNWQRDQPTDFIPLQCPLPSDARYREDLIWTYHNHQEYAQKWKLRVEAQQRLDRKLRSS